MGSPAETWDPPAMMRVRVMRLYWPVMAGTRTLEAWTAWMTPVTRTSCFASGATVAAGVVAAWTEAAGRSHETRTMAETAVAKVPNQRFIVVLAGETPKKGKWLIGFSDGCREAFRDLP